jgi:hypothetical protein
LATAIVGPSAGERVARVASTRTTCDGRLRQNDGVHASGAGPTPAYEFDAAVYEWQGPAAWHFVTVPVAISDEIAARTEGLTTGFGSVRVHVRIGDTSWSTSLFPDAKQHAYVLPVKKAVRVSEGLDAGSIAHVHLVLADARP